MIYEIRSLIGGIFNRLSRFLGSLLSRVMPISVKRRVGALIFHLDLWSSRVAALFGQPISERIVENPWVLENLDLQRGRVLEVGCCYSYLSHKLISLGFDVYGVDTSPFPQRSPKLKFYQADVRRMPFPDNFFDRIVVVSTLEHIGLGYFGDPSYEDGDFAAIKELRRVLKDDGKLLVTLPIARKQALFESLRVYDEDRLRRVTKGFLISDKVYFVRKSDLWVQASNRIVGSPNEDVTTIVCMVLEKES